MVNKADRPGANEAVADLRAMLALGTHSDWEPPIIETLATRGTGIDEVWKAVEAHLDLGAEGLYEARGHHRRAELEMALVEILRERASGVTAGADEVLSAVEAGDLDPWTGAHRLSGG